jgi:hypothetical protein
MEKIEKPQRPKSPEARKPMAIRFSPAERVELQKGADERTDGNLGLYVRTIALQAHRLREAGPVNVPSDKPMRSDPAKCAHELIRQVWETRRGRSVSKGTFCVYCEAPVEMPVIVDPGAK